MIKKLLCMRDYDKRLGVEFWTCPPTSSFIYVYSERVHSLSYSFLFTLTMVNTLTRLRS